MVGFLFKEYTVEKMLRSNMFLKMILVESSQYRACNMLVAYFKAFSGLIFVVNNILSCGCVCNYYVHY